MEKNNPINKYYPKVGHNDKLIEHIRPSIASSVLRTSINNTLIIIASDKQAVHNGASSVTSNIIFLFTLCHRERLP